MKTVEQIEKELTELSEKIWILRLETQCFKNWRTMGLVTAILRETSHLLDEAAESISED